MTPAFADMNDSPSAPMTFSIDVEPSVETLPDFAPQEGRSASAAAQRIVSAFFAMFFMTITSLKLFFLGTLIL